jgi:hypothetical protein
MFTKEEKRSLTQNFWAQFDQYCDTISVLAENMYLLQENLLEIQEALREEINLLNRKM